MALTTSDANTEWSYSTLDQVPYGVSFVLDPDGDLHLRAATTTLKVCSAALRRSSPVWKAMLFGPWEESKPNRNGGEQWLIELPEDPPVALHIAAIIAHGQITALPKTISIPTFADLLVFTDKYDMREVIRPFIPRWVDALGWHKVHVGSVEHVQAANIMWELGLVEELNSLMIKMVFEADREAFETLSSSTEASADVSRFIERAMLLRTKLIQIHLDFYREEYMSRIWNRCDKGPDSRLCDFAVLGAMASSLDPSGQRPPKLASDYPGSAHDLTKLLTGMFSVEVPMPGHLECGAGIKYASFEDSVMAFFWCNDSLSWEVQNQMEKRRKKADLFGRCLTDMGWATHAYGLQNRDEVI